MVKGLTKEETLIAQRDKVIAEFQAERAEMQRKANQLEMEIDAAQKAMRDLQRQKDKHYEKLEAYIERDVKVIHTKQLIEDYTTQIKKAKLAIKICRESLANEKKEIRQRYNESTYDAKAMKSTGARILRKTAVFMKVCAKRNDLDYNIGSTRKYYDQLITSEQNRRRFFNSKN